MENEWEDILPDIKKWRGGRNEVKTGWKYRGYNLARREILVALYQAEKEGKVCINPLTVAEIKEILDKTGKEIGCIKPSSIRMDKYAQAISDRIRKGK